VIRLAAHCAVATLIVLLPTSHEGKTRSTRPLKPVSDVKVVPLATQVGVASWYSDAFQGNETTSGELYDKRRLTAAHLHLPFGTRIKVTNLTNRRSVILRVNDRGPHVKGRLLDVSRAAAERLGFVGAGIAPVRLQVVSYPKWYLPRGVEVASLSPACVRPAR
jgi:rare lipoprotein A